MVRHYRMLIVSAIVLVAMMITPSYSSLFNEIEDILPNELSDLLNENINEDELINEDSSFFQEIQEILEDIDDDSSPSQIRKLLTGVLTSIASSAIKKRVKEQLFDFGFTSDQQRVFVISHGKSTFSNPLKETQMISIRPQSFLWLYSNKPGRFLPSKTVIISPRSDEKIKTLDGRQVGMVHRFVGLRFTFPSSSSESNVFFIGYANRVFGMDLSPQSLKK